MRLTKKIYLQLFKWFGLYRTSNNYYQNNYVYYSPDIYGTYPLDDYGNRKRITSATHRGSLFSR